ncbi:MAG: hypothetical protein IJS59_10145 [Bacteroidaceae bacterium]|nr:hypothetical protein [Bacteroidaceae bacterium]
MMTPTLMCMALAVAMATDTVPPPAADPLPHPADMATLMAAETATLDTAHTRELAVELEGTAFFKDNEYSGEHSKGYSLPGFWLRPRLTYQPLDAVRLELGAHALVFDGANKYPCYAYHDIGRWKGSQYQKGFHILPFFRATAVWKLTTFVLGDIYGGASHGMMEPLFTPEVNLTQDPEMGFQLLHRRRRYTLDAWVNWQSYIFEADTHQEAFTVGVVQRIAVSPATARVRIHIPIDIVVQHRGGEQDLPALDLGVQTLANGGVGLGLTWDTGCRAMPRLDADVAALGCWQQSGKLWPFDLGVAATAGVAATFRHELRAYARVVAARDFVPLYGSYFFSTLSRKVEGGRFAHVCTPQVGLEWSHTFGRDYVLGAKAEAYLTWSGRLSRPDGTWEAPAFANNFSFGVYFRCRPRIRLLRH